MSEQTLKQVNYTVACIHEFALRKGINQKDAYLYLDRYKGISFLNEFYDIEHTLSMEEAIDDMEKICRNDKNSFLTCLQSKVSKAEMLMEYITRDIVAWLMDGEKISMEEALNHFYTSETFSKLIDEETGLYLDASASVYALFLDEQKAGRLIQNEI